MTAGVCAQFQQEGKTYRTYEEDPKDRIQERVRRHYYNQHRLQTVEFVDEMHKKWLSFNHGRLSILDTLEMLADFLDESDPDVDEANLIHAYQTAEHLRKLYPDKPWLHLVGLVHDLGKVMSVWGEEQWAVTGDTYPVGCAPSDAIVYGVESFAGNPDLHNPKYRTKLGVYSAGCGLENLKMCWSHDEYMYQNQLGTLIPNMLSLAAKRSSEASYEDLFITRFEVMTKIQNGQVLVNHGSSLPEEALYAIRFHSFYPYHSHNAYRHFTNKQDEEKLDAILLLNSCDLYSKCDEKPDIEKLKPYYQALIDKYIPGVVSW